MSASTLTFSSIVDITTRQDGSRYRAEIEPGHVAVAGTELAAAVAVATKALTCPADARCIVSCECGRNGQGLFQARNRSVRPL